MRSIETNASSKVLPEQGVIVAATSMDEGEGETSQGAASASASAPSR